MWIRTQGWLTAGGTATSRRHRQARRSWTSGAGLAGRRWSWRIRWPCLGKPPSPGREWGQAAPRGGGMVSYLKNGMHGSEMMRWDVTLITFLYKKWWGERADCCRNWVGGGAGLCVWGVMVKLEMNVEGMGGGNTLTNLISHLVPAASLESRTSDWAVAWRKMSGEARQWWHWARVYLHRRHRLHHFSSGRGRLSASVCHRGNHSRGHGSIKEAQTSEVELNICGGIGWTEVELAYTMTTPW